MSIASSLYDCSQHRKGKKKQPFFQGRFLMLFKGSYEVYQVPPVIIVRQFLFE
jgi:hypothetical protein